MASGSGKWEVAGKDGKARKNTAGNKKNKSKISEADLPKLDTKAPIPESKTQFDAFNKKGPETFVIPKQESSDNDSDSHANSHSENRNRKVERKHKHHRDQPPTFEDILTDVLKKCDSANVRNFISEWKQKYPNNALVLLKDLTGFFQEKFIKMSMEKDPVLGDQLPDFPLCHVANDVQDHINDELKHCSQDEVDRFLSYCLDEMITEINKGHATYGVRLMIQCILKYYPHSTIQNRKEYTKRLISRKDNPREALSLLWAFGQTSDHKDLEERLAIWASLFLPVIENKNLSKYVIEYLEKTLSLKRPDRFTETPISGKKFQHIMELTYGINFLQFPYRRQLQLLFPEIKEIVFNSHAATAPLTKVFYQLFVGLSTELGGEYLQEALECLVGCLEKDTTCHYEWRNNYLARMKESSLLLKYIIKQWDSICYSLPQKHLAQTVFEFQRANCTALENEREKPKPVVQDCEESCKILIDLIVKSQKHIPNSKSSTITKIFKFLLFILLIFVSVDIYKHGGYKGSKTSKFLRQYGVEKVVINTYDLSKVYAQQVESWTEKNYPFYYKKVRDVVEPASDYMVTKLGEGLFYIANVTEPARQYIHKNGPPLLEKFDRFVTYYFNVVSKVLIKLWNDYLPIVRRHLQNAWDTVAIWVPRVWFRAQDLAMKTITWFYNLSPEFFDAIADGFQRLVNEVVTKTPHILALIQEYLWTAWTLLVSYISNVVLWLKTNVIHAKSNNEV